MESLHSADERPKAKPVFSSLYSLETMCVVDLPPNEEETKREEGDSTQALSIDRAGWNFPTPINTCFS